MGVETEPFASKQIKMCHLGVYNSIRTKHVHPKNLINGHATCIYRDFLYSKISKWFRDITINPPRLLEGL
jgi:hypothetical protein